MRHRLNVEVQKYQLNLYFQDVPLDLWAMVTPGILIGARIGRWLNHLAGPPIILRVFALLLVIEFLMTISKLTIFS